MSYGRWRAGSARWVRASPASQGPPQTPNVLATIPEQRAARYAVWEIDADGPGRVGRVRAELDPGADGRTADTGDGSGWEVWAGAETDTAPDRGGKGTEGSWEGDDGDRAKL